MYLNCIYLSIQFLVLFTFFYFENSILYYNFLEIVFSSEGTCEWYILYIFFFRVGIVYNMFFRFFLKVFRITNSSSHLPGKTIQKETQCVQQPFSVQGTPILTGNAGLWGRAGWSWANCTDQGDVPPDPSERGLPGPPAAVSDRLQCTVHMSQELPDGGDLGQLRHCLLSQRPPGAGPASSAASGRTRAHTWWSDWRARSHAVTARGPAAPWPPPSQASPEFTSTQ